jgi:hypothetical protein
MNEISELVQKLQQLLDSAEFDCKSESLRLDEILDSLEYKAALHKLQRGEID